jgi:hypothetical protein
LTPRILICTLLLPLLAGCPSNLEEQSRVSKLRVLAVRAEPPELVLAADASFPATTLTALAVEPGDAAVTVQFALCREITLAPSPLLPCPGDEGIDLPDAGPLSARLDLQDPLIVAFASSAQLDGGSFDSGGGIGQALDEGVPLLIGFTARADGGRLDGFSTLTLRSDARGPPGANPPPFDLMVGDGGPITAKQVVRLQPMTPPKDDLTARYGFSFFSTAGDISSLRSTDTTATGQSAETWVEWTAPDAPQPVTFWVVLRDGRGGVAWLEQTVQVH